MLRWWTTRALVLELLLLAVAAGMIVGRIEWPCRFRSDALWWSGAAVAASLSVTMWLARVPEPSLTFLGYALAIFGIVLSLLLTPVPRCPRVVGVDAINGASARVYYGWQAGAVRDCQFPVRGWYRPDAGAPYVVARALDSATWRVFETGHVGHPDWTAHVDICEPSQKSAYQLLAVLSADPLRPDMLLPDTEVRALRRSGTYWVMPPQSAAPPPVATKALAPPPGAEIREFYLGARRERQDTTTSLAIVANVFITGADRAEIDWNDGRNWQAASAAPDTPVFMMHRYDTPGEKAVRFRIGDGRCPGCERMATITITSPSDQDTGGSGQ